MISHLKWRVVRASQHPHLQGCNAGVLRGQMSMVSMGRFPHSLGQVCLHAVIRLSMRLPKQWRFKVTIFFQLVFAFMHHFELYFSWRLVVQLSPSCTAALSSALFLGSFAVKSLSHGSHGTPGQRGTVWLSAAAYDKAAFAGMCSKTLRSQAGSHTVRVTSCNMS